MDAYELHSHKGNRASEMSYTPLHSDHPPSRLDSYDEGRGPKDAQARDTSRSVSHQRGVGWRSLWWWWEICALVLAMGATVGIAVYLKILDDRPLREWYPSIQPNSLLAILTTVQKAALMVPVASGLSQLKWHHFTDSGAPPRRLGDLQLFDGASRGPWGSLLFLLQVPTRNKRGPIVAVGLALLTILALGIDPSAQQLLYFPIQQTEITDEPVTVGRADAYISTSTSALAQQEALNPYLIPLQFNILNSLRGTTFSDFYSCPQRAKRCVWDSITTFGVCSTSHTNTSVPSSGCNIIHPKVPRNSTFAACNYTISNHESANQALADASNPNTGTLTYRIPPVEHESANTVFTSVFRPGFYSKYDEFGEFIAWRAPPPSRNGSSIFNFTTPETFVPPNVDVFFGSLFWCSRTFTDITVSPTTGSGPGSRSVTYGSQTSERLRLVSTTNLTSPNVLYNYETISNSASTTADGNGVKKYSLEGGTYEGLALYFHTLLTSSAQDSLFALANGLALDTGTLLYLQPSLANTMSAIADTLTNLLRSTGSGTENSVTENLNATTVAGRAWFDETYIRVRWIWLLPLVTEAGLVLIFFTLTVLKTVVGTDAGTGTPPQPLDGDSNDFTSVSANTRRRRRREKTRLKTPLLKDSVLAYLATTVTSTTISTSRETNIPPPRDGNHDSSNNNDILALRPGTDFTELDDIADGIRVRLEEDGRDGKLVFVRKHVV
ncbi:hypothetical protein F5Y17DRAFT_442346 [Xylariaceae sp. FL0594]|nr:hypothetical protein F5Y17DRAFT_442346 [Xylariaceae sp. FL0594]